MCPAVICSDFQSHHTGQPVPSPGFLSIPQAKSLPLTSAPSSSCSLFPCEEAIHVGLTLNPRQERGPHLSQPNPSLCLHWMLIVTGSWWILKVISVSTFNLEPLWEAWKGVLECSSLVTRNDRPHSSLGIREVVAPVWSLEGHQRDAEVTTPLYYLVCE